MIKKGAVSAEEYYNLEGYTNYSLIKSVSENGNNAFRYLNKESSLTQQKIFDSGHILERYFLEDKDTSYIKIDDSEELTAQSLTLYKAILQYCKDRGYKSTRKISDARLLSLIRESKV